KARIRRAGIHRAASDEGDERSRAADMADAAAQLLPGPDRHEHAVANGPDRLGDRERRGALQARQDRGARHLEQQASIRLARHGPSPIAAAMYPTTALLSPVTSPESPYARTEARLAPRSRDARSTASSGPPPHAWPGLRASASSSASASNRPTASTITRSSRQAVAAS